MQKREEKWEKKEVVKKEEVKKEVKKEEVARTDVWEVEGVRKVKKRAPIIIERIHPVEVEEIQPVIHRYYIYTPTHMPTHLHPTPNTLTLFSRKREVTEVHEVIQPIHEEKILAAATQERELVPEHKHIAKST